MLQKSAGIEDRKMYNTFNMGIGLVLAVSPEDEAKVAAELRRLGEDPVLLGKVVEGEGVIL